MDKQLVEEFNKKYFGKNQLKRRIYEENELEIIWKEISMNRKKTSISMNIRINEESDNWYNITEDVGFASAYIYDIEKSEITKYLSDNMMIKYIESKNEKLLEVKDIEKFYIDTYSNNINKEIYRHRNQSEFLSDYNFATYKLKSSEKINSLLVKLLEFMESHNSGNSIIKSAILHFYIIYLSPFISHNLEMAEYISNRYLIENGYEIIKYCNILDLIRKDERKYYNALENSMINDGDITYFIKYYIGAIQVVIKELTKEVTSKNGKKIIKELIEKNNVSLEDRQIKFINSMLILNSNKISIDDYKRKSKISYETARSDLNELVAIGFFKISKSGKKYEYYFNDISTIIDNFNDINMILKC